MNSMLNKIASVLAFVIGAMAVFAGAKVLIGIDPGYNVINWLPLYNYTMGILTVFATAILLWRKSRWAIPAAITTLGVHAVVMAILQTAYRSSVAPESTQAMTLRLAVWLVVLILEFFYSRGRRVVAGPALSSE